LADFFGIDVSGIQGSRDVTIGLDEEEIDLSGRSRSSSSSDGSSSNSSGLEGVGRHGVLHSFSSDPVPPSSPLTFISHWGRRYGTPIKSSALLRPGLVRAEATGPESGRLVQPDGTIPVLSPWKR
jgi:hypothetical protein